MGQIVIRNTEQIPPGYHLATTEERECLPEGSKYLYEGAWHGSDWFKYGLSAKDGTAYICPDAPVAVAPAPLSKGSMQHAANEFIKTGIGPFPPTPEGFHIATTEELWYLPRGSKFFKEGVWRLVPPAWFGKTVAKHDDAIYFCPNIQDDELVVRGPYVVLPANPPPLDPKRAAGALKPQLQLIPPVFNEAVAAALAHGAPRYGPWNWRSNRVEMMTYLGAMKRHIDALLDGEDLAPDSGVHHLGHIAASCAIVLDAGKHGTLVDNRPPRKP